MGTLDWCQPQRSWPVLRVVQFFLPKEFHASYKRYSYCETERRREGVGIRRGTCGPDQPRRIPRSARHCLRYDPGSLAIGFRPRLVVKNIHTLN